mmetsp:Transcript_10696/g.12257  ORF Transcript_10696/g.12257 Transcript_10696/m.12257 type:complete len:147 (-) Transcript_10696:1487-1927(-)|eukprot:CAMPEP_0184061658 /NCGR_PEP_ID=MMETSP0956-20121227/11651_1 /TAXON_ID=627963 /ORGANISM="Aplanochytrium sp, Strain PBS07" /LENGTH=146 /DNA_ID=CAMNT_0026358211 /DNA_START=100 /DNA_END=540 /DNA_ORIENTATION=+
MASIGSSGASLPQNGLPSVSTEGASSKEKKGVKVDKIENIHGSTAGASSSSFHIFRKHRRTEMFRLAEMDREHETKLLNEALANKRKQNEVEANRKTNKNAEKRRRKKMKKRQLMMESKRKKKEENNNREKLKQKSASEAKGETES